MTCGWAYYYNVYTVSCYISHFVVLYLVQIAIGYYSISTISYCISIIGYSKRLGHDYKQSEMGTIFLEFYSQNRFLLFQQNIQT